MTPPRKRDYKTYHAYQEDLKKWRNENEARMKAKSKELGGNF